MIKQNQIADKKTVGWAFKHKLDALGFALLGVVHHLLDANQVIHELFHRAGAVHFIDGDVGFTETAGTEPERNAADRAADGSRARLALSHEHERVGRM
jgi:hypothetical protein